MSHFQQRKFVEFVRDQFSEFFKNTRVLEVGSWDNNGTIRNNFEACDYTGVDVAPGRGVDLVSGGQDLQFPTGHFDVVISSECFEHNPFWSETFINMNRMLRPGGLCVITCATRGRHEHGTTRTTPQDSLTSKIDLPDYYRNLTHKDFERASNLPRVFFHFEFFYNIFSKDLYFIGIKNGPGLDERQILSRLVALREQTNRLTTEKGASSLYKFEKRLSWVIKAILIPLFGEERYRNFRIRK